MTGGYLEYTTELLEIKWNTRLDLYNLKYQCALWGAVAMEFVKSTVVELEMRGQRVRIEVILPLS